MKLVAPSIFAVIASATDIDYRLTDGASQIASLFLTDASFNSQVFNHGCWCGKLSSLPSIGLGGKAINELDQICKNWNKARACTRLEGSNCYNQANDATYEIQQLGSSLSCTDTDACLLETCQIDSQYAGELEAWWQTNGGSFNFATDIITNPTCESGQRSGLSCPNANRCYTQNYVPNADDFVIADNQDAVSGYTNLPLSFYHSETGSAWINRYYSTYQQFQGAATQLTDDSGFATGDGFALKFSNSIWIRLSAEGADVSTFNFNNCLGTSSASNCWNDGDFINNYPAFIVGCGNDDCSPANFDFSTTLSVSGSWVSSFRMASIHVKTSLYNEWNTCLATGFRSGMPIQDVSNGETSTAE